jgi:hypothetical protein
MACIHVADGGDSFQILRIPENMLNKLLWTAYKG